MIFLRESAKFLDDHQLGTIDITIRVDLYTEGIRPFDINKVHEYLKKACTTGKPVTRRLNKRTIVIFRKPKRYTSKKKIPKEVDCDGSD